MKLYKLLIVSISPDIGSNERPQHEAKLKIK